MSAATARKPVTAASQPARSVSHAVHHLGEWAATAICGNDILSSCLYVSGIAILYAGAYAPIVLLLIGFVLFLYKKVYTEVVEALPVNGGAYNCLLNSTRKFFAANGGSLTFLSYIATAVLSAKVGTEYLLRIMPAVEHWLSGITVLHFFGIPEEKHAVTVITMLVLLGFAILNILGIKESAKVAMFIFFTHVAVLIIFCVAGGIYVLSGSESFLMANLEKTQELVNSPVGAAVLEEPRILARGGVLLTMFFAFSASLLGVSGFESSANFVEEQDQKKKVFRKTLRNMLICVTVFNPLIALVVLNAMPYASIAQSSDYLLSDAALALGGMPLNVLVCVDAFLVLCGAVLTSYVGVCGLVSRMSIDGCFPQFFAKKNSRDAYTRIIVAFFILCASILIVTKAELLSLAGVYTIAFLGVMSLFAIGNLALKTWRPTMKRTYRAPVVFVVLAAGCTIAGMIGNILIDQRNPWFFLTYYAPTAAIIIVIAYRDSALRLMLMLLQPLLAIQEMVQQWLRDTIKEEFVVFIRKPERLAAILDYIRTNETGKVITIVCCTSAGETDDVAGQSAARIRSIIEQIELAGFCQGYTINVHSLLMPFGPEAIEHMSKERNVPRNRIFIGSLPTTSPLNYEDLGGVRIIFS